MTWRTTTWRTAFNALPARLMMLVALTLGLITMSVTTMHQWSREQELASYQALAQSYAALLEDTLVQTEADLQRSSANGALYKQAPFVMERLPWITSLQERSNSGELLWQSGAVGNPSLGSAKVPVDTTLALIEGANALGRMHFADVQTAANGDALIPAAWPFSASKNFGVATLSLTQLLDKVNHTSTVALGANAKWLGGSIATTPNALNEQTIRLGGTGLHLRLRFETTEGLLQGAPWQLYGLPVMTLILAMALAMYVREMMLRQRAEAITREQQEQIQANSRFATLGEIAAMIAHEINQPLSAMEMYTTTCQKVLASERPQLETLNQALLGLRSQTERASRIIRSVQDFAQNRSETAQGLDVMVVLRDLIPLIEIQAKRFKAVVRVQGERGVPVVADKTMLEQVLLNLVRNGLEAMRDTPQDNRQLHINVARHDGWLEVKVIDQGCGVAPEMRSKLFSAFVTNKPKGTGVGLSLCKSLVEKHQGRIHFEDNPQGGTIFVVELPIDTVRASVPSKVLPISAEVAT